MKSFRERPEYEEWKRRVKERYNNTCQLCGHKGNIHAHHIKPVSEYPELAFDVDNGITLCGNCHAKYRGREDELEQILLESTLEDVLVDDSSGKYYYDKADALCDREDYHTALSVINQGLELTGDDAFYYPLLLSEKVWILNKIFSSDVLDIDEDYTKILEELCDIVRENPSEIRYYSSFVIISFLANCYLKQYGFDKAIALLKEFIKIAEDLEGSVEDPNRLKRTLSDLYCSLGDTYQKRRNYELALSSYEKAIEIDNKNPNAYFYMGMFYQFSREGNYKKALEAYKKAYLLEPDETYKKAIEDLVEKM